MTCSPADLLAEAKCFLCLTPQQLDAIEADLLCKLGAACYGGLYIDDAAGALSTPIADTYYPVADFEAGLSQNITIDLAAATERLICQAGADGIYLCNISISFGGTPNTEIHMALFKNGVKQENISLQRKLGGGDVGSAGANGLVQFNAGEYLDLRLATDSAGSNYTINHAGFNIHRVQPL